jgi:hypothetical protein
MEGAVTVTVNQYLAIGVTLALFGFLGFRRGVNRELFAMLGIGVAMWLANALGPSLVPMANRMYKLLRFVLTGSLTAGDPAGAWQKAQAWPDLIHSAMDVELLSVAFFVLIVALFYLWGQQRVRAPGSAMSNLLGLLAGGINGFLVALYLVPAMLPRATAVITLPSGQISATLGTRRNIALAIVCFTVLLIAFGLHNAKPPRGDSDRRG